MREARHGTGAVTRHMLPEDTIFTANADTWCILDAWSKYVSRWLLRGTLHPVESLAYAQKVRFPSHSQTTDHSSRIAQ